MKKIIKISIILIMSIIILSQFNIVYGAGGSILEETITGANNFIQDNKITKTDENGNTKEVTLINTSDLKKTSDVIFNTLFIIGVALTVGIGGYLGIKFMLSSVEEKAEIKQLLTPYIIGCILIYGAFGIWKATLIFLNKV